MYSIKILQDTPFDKAHTILRMSDFRYKYHHLINTHNSDEFAANYIREGYKQDHIDTDLSKWFEVITVNSFKVGDWVWHEGEKKAFTIVIDSQKFRPHYCTLAAVHNCSGIYKRLATKEEITFYDLTSFCDGQVLVGQYRCYHFNDIWKELIGIHRNITKYLQIQKEFSIISKLAQFSSKIELNWSCIPNGLKVGCQSILHEEVLQIANILKLK